MCRHHDYENPAGVGAVVGHHLGPHHVGLGAVDGLGVAAGGLHHGGVGFGVGGLHRDGLGLAVGGLHHGLGYGGVGGLGYGGIDGLGYSGGVGGYGGIGVVHGGLAHADGRWVTFTSIISILCRLWCDY